MSWLELVAVLFAFASVAFTVRQNVWCWPTGIVGCALYAVVFFGAKLYADVVLQIVMAALSVLGWARWIRPPSGEVELPVTTLTAWERLGWALAWAAGVVAWASFLERYTDASLPWADSATVVASLVAQILLTRKVLENWPIWVAADVAMVGIYAAKELYLTAGLYVVFTGLAIAGWHEWNRRLGASEYVGPAEGR